MKSIKHCMALMAALSVLASCGKEDMKRFGNLFGGGTTYTCASIKTICPEGLKDTLVIGEFSSEMKDAEQETWENNGARLDSKVSYRKRFRWFYTEYTFTQTFYSLGYRFPVPIDRAGNKDMITYWFTGHPDLMRGLTGAETALKMREIEPLVDKWVTDNVMEVIRKEIEFHKDRIHDPLVSKEELLSLRDSAVAYLANCKQDSTFDMRRSSRNFYRKEVENIIDGNTFCGRQIRGKLYGLFTVMNLRVPYKVKMPGVICGGTDIHIADNIASFYITGERLIPGNYTISATSRAINLWAVIVSILLVVAAAVGIRRYWLRRHRNLNS